MRTGLFGQRASPHLRTAMPPSALPRRLRATAAPARPPRPGREGRAPIQHVSEDADGSFRLYLDLRGYAREPDDLTLRRRARPGAEAIVDDQITRRVRAAAPSTARLLVAASHGSADEDNDEWDVAWEPSPERLADSDAAGPTSAPDAGYDGACDPDAVLLPECGTPRRPVGVTLTVAPDGTLSAAGAYVDRSDHVVIPITFLRPPQSGARKLSASRLGIPTHSFLGHALSEVAALTARRKTLDAAHRERLVLEPEYQALTLAFAHEEGYLQAAGARMWNSAFRVLVPRLNARALRLARAVHRGLALYNVLCARPDLMDFVDQARPFGVLLEPSHLEHLPAGLSLPEALRRVIALDHADSLGSGGGHWVTPWFDLRPDDALEPLHPAAVSRRTVHGRRLDLGMPDVLAPALAWRASTLALEPRPPHWSRPATDAARDRAAAKRQAINWALAHAPAPSPGFMAWARGVRWTPAHVPHFTQSTHHLVTTAYQFGPFLDPNRIRQLRRPAEWLLLNYAITTAPDRPTFAAWVLRSPAAALDATRVHATREARAVSPPPRGAALLNLAFRYLKDGLSLAHEAYGHAYGAGSPFASVQSFARALEVSHQHHNALVAAAALADAHRLQASNVVFPEPLVREVTAEGCTLRLIPDFIGLAEESMRMHHCVRTHRRTSLDGTRVVYSVRGADDARLATLEVDGFTYQVLEIKAIHNHAVAPELVAAARAALASTAAAAARYVALYRAASGVTEPIFAGSWLWRGLRPHAESVPSVASHAALAEVPAPFLLLLQDRHRSALGLAPQSPTAIAAAAPDDLAELLFM